MLFASAASAQPAPAHGPVLNWVRLPGAESCIAPVELARRVEARLGRQVFVRASDAIVVIEGRVAPDASGFTTVIRVSDPDGTVYGSRELSVPGTDCHKLDAIVALIISVTIRRQHGDAGIELPSAISAELDALFAGEPSVLDPSELPASPVERHEDPRPEPRPAPTATATASERALWLQLEAAFGMSAGLAPAPTFGPSLRFGVERSGLGSVALSAGFGLLQTERADDARGTLVYQPFSSALELCWDASRFGPAQLALCADGRLGLVRVDAREFVSRYGSSKLWFELGAAASLRTRLLGPSYLHFRLGLPWRIARPRFQYQDSSGNPKNALRMKPFGVDLELGLGVEF